MNPNMPYYPPYGSYMPIPPEELQKQAERTALKRRGAGIGLGIIGMLAVSFVLSALLFGTAAALAGDISSGDPDFQYLNPTLYYALYMILYVLMVVTPFAVLIPIFRLHLRDVCSLHRTAHPGIIALAAVGGLAVCMVSNWMTNEYVTLLSAFGIENAPSEMPIDDSVAGHILYFITIAVLPAIAEEFAFRGVVFHLLRPYGKTLAIFGSAFVFGLMHGNVVQIPFAFVIGLFFGYVVAETGSLLPAMAMHFLNNGFSVMQEFMQERLSESASLIAIYVSYLLATLIGIAALVVVLRRDPHFFRAQEDCATQMDNRAKFRAFAGSAGMIAAYVLIGIEVLLALNWGP